MTNLARRLQKIERITAPTVAQLVQKLFAQTIDVKDLGDKHLDEAIAYPEQRPLVEMKRRMGRPIQGTGE